MDRDATTAAIQRFLDQLGGLRGDAPAEPVIRDLVGRAAGRLHQLCAALLYRSYPRLARGPMNLQSDEMLGAVVARLMKALRQVRPKTVRQFFQIANQHMRWELNDLARRLDDEAQANRISQHEPAFQESSTSQLSPIAKRLFSAIDELPDDEREAFELVRIQGMSHAEAAGLLGVTDRTVLRRLNRSVLLLSEKVGDLRPIDAPPGT